MKLFLLGGAEIDQPERSVSLLKKIIKETFLQLNPKTILHIPFARLQPSPQDKGEWDEGWFNALMSDTGIEIIDARKKLNDNKLTKAAVFINGGRERQTLLNTIRNNDQLQKAIANATHIVAESSGSMIMGEYLRISRTNSDMMKGLGILKNTVIEPHYTERGYNRYLPDDLKKSGMKYGIGIDSATGIITDPHHFPEKWEKIGPGNVFIITQ
jgi:cyanophycinase-like exopeptidase